MMDERLLISEVRKYEVLFNANYNKEGKRTARYQAWGEISAKLGTTISRCRNTWSRLRTVYAVTLARHQKKVGRASTVRKQWKFQKDMSFLEPYMQTKRPIKENSAAAAQTDNEDVNSIEMSEADETEEILPTVKSEVEEINVEHFQISGAEEFDETLSADTMKKGTTRLDYVSEGMSQIFNKTDADCHDEKNVNKPNVPEIDEVDMFYLSIAKIVKKLPATEQAKLRMTFCQMVSEAEIRYLEVNNPSRPSSTQLPTIPSVNFPPNYYNNTQPAYSPSQQYGTVYALKLV